MKDGGTEIKPMEEVDLFTQMEMSTMETGSTTRLMDLVSTAISTEQSTKANGKKINNMGKALKPGLMEPSTRDSMLRERSTDTEHSHGLTVAYIKVSSSKITSREKEPTTGLTVESTTETGSTTKWKAKEFSHGQTAESTREHIVTTKKKVRESSFGQTVESTKEAGSMENSTASALTPQLAESRKKVNGKMERE